MDIFNFSNYRDIIRQCIKNRKGSGQVGRLASAIPMHSTQLSQVLSGRKELNLEQAYSACEYLELNDIEIRYFILLVEKQRAGTHKLKNFFDQQLKKIKKESLQVSQRLKEHRNLTNEEKSIFYSSWQYSAIRLFCSIGKGATVEEISEHFSIERKKCLEILNFLNSTGLCKINDHRYQIGAVHTHVGADSPHVIKHHMNWRLKSLLRQENLHESELVFTCPMSLSKKDFAVIREKLVALITESLEIAKKSEAEDLFFLTVDWLKV